MKKEITLREQIEAFQNDKSFPGDMSHCYNFYDWFCKDEALKGKAEKLMPKVIKFAKKMNIDLDKHYVFFKNNCPMSGSLYDDFRICDIQTSEVVYNVTPQSGHSGLAEVYGRENNFQSPLFEGQSWSEMFHNLIPANWSMPLAAI
jgi:hypothetical protein